MVSVFGDFGSLFGGMLFVMFLVGVDGEIYVVGQGFVVIGGFLVEGDVVSIFKGVFISGWIVNGVIIEWEVVFDLEGF